MSADPVPDRPIDMSALRKLSHLLLWGVVAALIALVAANKSGLLAAVGIGTLIFLAAFATGGFLGFLFGVPRVLSRSNEPAPPQGGAATPGVAGGAGPAAAPAPNKPLLNTGLRLLSSNTNLERISDWLTTMLVGAGLVELHKVNDALLKFREFLESSARVFPVSGGAPSAGSLPAVGPIVLVFGVFCGFLFMYLNTRLVLVRMFQAIEELISGNTLGASEQRAVRAIALEGATERSFVSQNLGKERSLTVEDALNLMFDLLYKSDPDRVIEIGAQLSATEAVNRPDYWFYLAAAFGQKMSETKPGSDEWNSNRDNALDCARRAVSLNPSYRARLWKISTPGGPDDDLAPLRDDREFLRIVGRT